MINRRIAIFALVVVLVFTSIAVGRKFVSKNYNWSDNVKSMYNLYVDILK